MRETKEKQAIVMLGNPIDGLSFRGPYANTETALDSCGHMTHPDFWIAELEPC